MRNFLTKMHHNIWYRLRMAEAYLAYHRGDRYECACLENDARQHERALQLIWLKEELSK